MSCQDKKCYFYMPDYALHGNCEVHARIGFGAIFEYCKKYIPPKSELRETYIKYLNNDSWTTQQKMIRVIVDEIEKLKEGLS